MCLSQRQRQQTTAQATERPAGMIEIHARRGEHTLRVYASPDGQARSLTRQLTLALLANLGEITLPDDPAEGTFASPHALDGLHVFVLEAKTRAQSDLDALVVCPTCTLGVSPAASIARRTWAELGYHAGDTLTLCVTGQRFAELAQTNSEGEGEGEVVSA